MEDSNEIMRKMIEEAIKECTNADLLDLIYKLLIVETKGTGEM